MNPRQEAFNRAVAGLAKQDFAQARIESDQRDGTACAYQTPDGKRCAYGHLMSDEFLEILRANGRLSAASSDILAEYSRAPGRGLGTEFIARLQEAHDYGATPTLMKTSLKDFANKYGLEIPEVLK